MWEKIADGVVYALIVVACGLLEIHFDVRIRCPTCGSRRWIGMNRLVSPVGRGPTFVPTEVLRCHRGHEFERAK